MSESARTALIVIDAQESFRQRSYFDAAEMPAYLAAQNALIEGARNLKLPIARVFHVDPESSKDPHFTESSGYVRPIAGLADFNEDVTIRKHRHSALAGTDLAAWLNERGIRRVIVSGIRTEQCCETTTRAASDAGFTVDYVTAATLTFAMETAAGRVVSPAEIRERTELVLADRFATICTVEQALARA